jgi:hypothetical protein
LPFKCNLQRYTADASLRAALALLAAPKLPQLDAQLAAVGLCTLNN